MPQVRFTPHLRLHLDVVERSYPGETVAAVLAGAFADFPKLRGYLLDDQDRLRKHVTIFVNSATIRDRNTLSDPLAAGDEVFVFQALSGG
ncbi:MAG TPA: MoaD/ThiS family protein [Planctomycetaceae bacterium]|nr:MoaD/ThiS family protein [Planctomycetaceae bacterium]